MRHWLIALLLCTGCAPLEKSHEASTERELRSLRGDTKCAWGSANCNRCVRNVVAKFDSIGSNFQTEGRIRFDGYAYPAPGWLLERISDGDFEHIQSIGRIGGLGNQEFMVFTHSTASEDENKQGAIAIVRMGANQLSGGHAFGGMPNGDGPDQNISNRTVARTFAGNNHPGGLSVLGHYVYVAQWCQLKGEKANRWCDESSALNHGMGFSVYDIRQAAQNGLVNSHPPVHRHYRHVYDEFRGKAQSTASVAATRLKSRIYLVVLGADGGSRYFFYTSRSPTGPFTFQGESEIELWGENAAIVTDCATGELFLFQMEGYGSSDDEDKVHLYRIVRAGGSFGFEFIKSRTFYCRGPHEIDGARDWCHFDAGAGLYVTPSGNLALYATEWQQSNSGNIRIVEFF